MKSAWIRIIEQHTVPVERDEIRASPTRPEGSAPPHGRRIVRGASATISKEDEPHGSAYLEVYPQGLALGADRGHHPEPLCFIAQIVDVSDDDCLILHQAFSWVRIITGSVCYLPWGRIGSIRFVTKSNTDA